MDSYKVPAYFADCIGVECFNTEVKQVSASHYGALPWSKEKPLFASRAEKYKVFKDGSKAVKTEKEPVYCIRKGPGFFFVIQAFKAVTTPPLETKRDRESKAVKSDQFRANVAKTGFNRT